MRPRSRPIKHVRALLLACLVAGCAQTPQEHVQQVGSETDQAAASFDDCLKQIRNKPAYASLVPHSSDLGTSQPSMAQLTDETLPSPEDARLVAARFDENNVCRSKFLNALATPRPDLVPIFEDAFTKREGIAVLLVERKTTWAEAARRTKNLSSDLQQRLASANRQWLADLAAHRSDANRREAAAAALMHWSTEQQMSAAINSR